MTGPAWSRMATPAVVALWLVVWHVRSAGSLTFATVACAFGFVALCTGYGAVFARATASLVADRTGALHRLLTGFFVLNTLLFLLTLATPFGIAGNVAIVAVLPWIALALLRTRGGAASATIDERPGLAVALVAGLAATLWSSELQPVMQVQGDTAVFRAWFDIFVHVREISTFAQSHGLASMSDIKMAGSPAPIYHFASYIPAAVFSALTHTSALANFGGLQLPLGILLMAVGAFVLVGTVWSPWAGMAAAVAVATLPDAYEQGFGMAYLGFRVMSQINLGMLYGIACIAVAWVFMIEGCRRANARAIVVAWVFLALSLSYKAHVFVANAYVLFVFPWIFFAGARRLAWRVAGVVAATAIFVAVIKVSQMSPKVPTIRLDGSGFGQYMRILLFAFDDGAIRRLFESLLIAHSYGRLVDAVTGALFILFGSFGVWTLVAPLAVWRARRAVDWRVPAFVAVVALNYLVMAMGLAVDERRIGGPEELLNRPVAWAYFVIVAFGCAALWQLAFAGDAPRSRRAQALVVVFFAAALAGVAVNARDAQTFASLPGHHAYADFNAVPVCAVRAAEYLRDHGHPDDLVQDSRSDPNFVITALAERQMYVVESFFAGKATLQDARLKELAPIVAGRDVAALDALAARTGLRWFVLHPDANAPWPKDFTDRAVFECGGHRVIPLRPSV